MDKTLAAGDHVLVSADIWCNGKNGIVLRQTVENMFVVKLDNLSMAEARFHAEELEKIE